MGCLFMEKSYRRKRTAKRLIKWLKIGGNSYTQFEGGVYSLEWFWSKILHTIRADEAVQSAAFSWIELCDWIPATLTGNLNPLELKRSRCAAGHKAMWHFIMGGFTFLKNF